MFRANPFSSPLRSRIVSGRLLGLAALGLLLVLTAGCSNRYENQQSLQWMGNQPKYYPLGHTDFFQNNMQSRPLEPGTVPRGPIGLDAAFTNGKPSAAGAASGQATPAATGAAGARATGTPAASGAQAPSAGATPAAGQAAAGQAAPAGGGFVEEFPFEITPAVMLRGQQRFNAYCTPCHGFAGFGDGMIVQRGYTKPPSFHIDRLRQAAPGYYVNVIANGFGQMPDYAAQVAPDDRWAIAAYIRALQLSQNAKVSDLTPEQRTALGAGGQ
ncbi:MAG: cytochrome c [Anaerolineae bacterium]